MLIQTTTVFVTLLLPLIYGLDVNPTVLNSKSGAICSSVQQHKGKGHIKVHGHNLPQDVKVPTFVFHYPDLLNFTNVPRVESYYKEYPDNLPKDLFSGDKFNIVPEERSDFNDAKVFNGYVDSTRDAEFIVPQTGIYCVYIGKVDDAKATIPVVFKNSYGNLDYPSYLIYSQLKYVIIAAIGLFVYLFNYILRFKVGEDFKNLDSISVISKAVIFLVLTPYILVYIYYWFSLFLRNNFINSSQDSMLVSLASFVSEFLVQAYGAYTHGLLLLFSMGYGVIYYHNGNSHHYRLFPRKTFGKVVAFLVVYLVVLYAYFLLINHPSEQYPYLSGFGNLGSLDESSSSWSSVLASLVGLFSLILFILTMYNYFQTKKTIAKFPPSANDPDSTQRVVDAFRKSILIFMVLPIVVGIIGGVIGAVNMVRGLVDTIPDQPPNRLDDYESVLNFIALESTFGSLVQPVLVSQWIYFFTAVVAIFFIWIKDNNGLIIDRNVNDPIEYADVSQFDVSDSE
ncbi:hypothetical protein Cantr_02596 [Candida viswanathii]|uniref:Membrane protein PTM1 n=1 Tax=Candida viswanathii TaxID=5486 RepID=A0A367YMI2_9ASCO|nr:hypothetical protein Cantr_02596 [Candida viswanathii]